MSASRPTDLPTLTEVVELAVKSARQALPPAEAPLPPLQEAVALEDDALDRLRFAPTLSEPHLAPPPPPAQPLAPGISPEQALAYDEELVAQVMVRLQPRLEAWVEAQVRRSLMEMLPVWAESASLSIVRDLRAEIPELLSIALDEVHRARHG